MNIHTRVKIQTVMNTPAATGLTAEEAEFDSRQRKEICFLLHNFQIGSGALPASYATGTVTFLLELS
jgi:hypothetical protein